MRAVNLIPSDQRSGASVGAGRSQGGAYAVLALLAGVAVLALLYGMAGHKISDRRAEAASIASKVALAEAEATKLAPYTSFLALRESRMQAVNTLVSSRFDWAHAFHEFGRVLPSDISISSLTGAVGSTEPAAAAAPAPAATSTTTSTTSTTTTPAAETAPAAAAVTSATPPGSVPIFTLTGCATTQPAVARMLERLRLIDGVDEVTLQSSTASGTSGSSSAAGGCAEGGPAFTVEITFKGLPAAATSATTASTAAAGTVATEPTSSAASATTTTPTGTETNG